MFTESASLSASASTHSAVVFDGAKSHGGMVRASSSVKSRLLARTAASEAQMLPNCQLVAFRSLACPLVSTDAVHEHESTAWVQLALSGIVIAIRPP